MVLVIASVAAAEVMVAETLAKQMEVGLSVGAQQTHRTGHPKMMDKSIVVDGLAVLFGRGPGICGVEGVFGRKCKIRDCKQNSSSQQVSGELETRSEFFMAPEKVAPEHCQEPQCGWLFSGFGACGRR